MGSLPLTLIMGSEQVLVERALSDARVSAGRHFGESPSVQTLVLGDATPEALAEALSPTLFGEATLVVIEGADQFEDETFAVLDRAIADPPDGFAVVVHHPGGVKGKRYLTAIRAAGATEVSCAALKKGRATQDFLLEEVRRHGRKATPDALRALYDSIGHDLPLLVGAIHQLCADLEADPITDDDVRAYFGGIADMQGYRVSDSIWERRPVDALRDLRWAVEGSGRAGVGPAITAAIASGLRNMARIQGMPPSASDADVMQETGIRFDWQVRNVRARAKKWRPDRLAKATVTLSGVDVAMKGGLRPGDALDVDQKLHVLEEFVVRTASPSSG
ncbi:MAG: DNA polymerase III subunit delta [Actinomycetota bacterium]